MTGERTPPHSVPLDPPAERPPLSRREFSRLLAAAFGGVVAGTAAGCGTGTDQESGDGGGTDSPAGRGGGSSDEPAPGASDQDGTESEDDGKLVGGERPELNACLGLNQCRDYGKNPGEHDCAGQGACATAHSPGPGENTCKFLGGCAEGPPGANACKGQGGCQVPMSPGGEAWQAARQAFVERMQEKGVEVGPAPLPGQNGGSAGGGEQG